MDSLISAAARALAGGDPLRALNHVSLRDDAPALALRGIAMAQLGDLARARALLRRAARAFTTKETVARARCVVAEAEVALAARDLHASSKALDAARETLQRHGDTVNAAHARYLAIHRLLLIGRLDDAEQQLKALNTDVLPPALQATHQLAVAGIALRRLDTATARTALGHAGQVARRSGIAALINEVDKAARVLQAPAARLVTHDEDRPVRLDEVEALFASPTLVVDACRYSVHQASAVIELATRPVLFTLARTLAEAWPGDARRDTLIERAFRLRQVEESHRARLRKALRPLARLHATRHGFKLEPLTGDVAVLARPVEDKHAPILAFLSDGEAWSSSALALALGTSQRTVQRALDALANAGKVEAIGQGRARRWVASPVLGFTTTLLLTAPLPGG
ncbi:MAG TPA: helix-turn-helix domain-containing protein [Alcanivorax sp.]|jgi:DNA-binding transcriptional ArsR family regulator|nr:helix-turn-helix domain-containing protein [Pseudomonadota bacterium]HAD64840.1 helix-turn-helix domain-containing protein [Alcanivorax sp.]HBP75457.1 helix-turn-helix domain-containing protein [Alcanivorax sp.]HBY48611.1 helix-turn-helix domain-containing protein [Alcanivorax sp.]|tara:strand:- start:425 stop:1621 length:1197 start_codon:yes stop_codon:yes gene_type:complete